MDNTKHWLEYLTAISALIAATAAIFAAIFSGLQASVANDTERRQLRAYVNIGSKDELSNFVENGKAHVQGVAENVGQTPVYDATWVSGINVLPTSGQRFSYSSCEQIMRSADAKRWFFGKLAYPDKDREKVFTDTEIANIKSKNASIYFNGRFCYKDIFDMVRHTDFCIKWTWETDRLSGAVYCENGNAAD